MKRSEPARELHVRYIEHAHILVWRGLEITNLRRVRVTVSGVGVRAGGAYVICAPHDSSLWTCFGALRVDLGQLSS